MVQSSSKITHKHVSRRTLLIVGLVLAIGVVLLVPSLNSGRPRPWFVNDLDNLHYIVGSYHDYAQQNYGDLPSHASQVKDGQTIGDWEFVSRHDPNGQVKPTVNVAKPDAWYTYGSYRFYPTHGLNMQDVAEPALFVIAYCPPFKAGIDGKDHPTVYLDGRTEMLSKDELFDLIVAQQQQMIQKIKD